jgi:hypothetical protein
MRLMIVELSERVRRIVVAAASGPLTSARTAACGRYAKTNMNAITPVESVKVGASFERRGFHKELWLRK